jgi:hypothetical protein
VKIFIEEHVPTPPNGEIKCYFHNFYPCSYLSWTEVIPGGTEPSRTIIILSMPTNIDFRKSAIPFTITTEGGISTLTANLGKVDEGFIIDKVV